MQVGRMPGWRVGVAEAVTLTMDLMRETSHLTMGDRNGFLEDATFEVGLEVDRAFMGAGVGLIGPIGVNSVQEELEGLDGSHSPDFSPSWCSAAGEPGMGTGSSRPGCACTCVCVP